MKGVGVGRRGAVRDPEIPAFAPWDRDGLDPSNESARNDGVRKKYGDAFRRLIKDAGVEPVQLPPRSPNLNAYAERCVRSVKDECLGKLILFGERSLRCALKQYDAHYHAERNHQSRKNRLIEPASPVGSVNGEITCSNRLGGLLRYYYRAAA